MFECVDVRVSDTPCACCEHCKQWLGVWTILMALSTSHVSIYVSVVPGMNAGTTSTVALLRDGIELVVGSVGDSRAMLCRKGKALKLTVDHTPERKDEKERYKDVVSCATFDKVHQQEIKKVHNICINFIVVSCLCWVVACWNNLHYYNSPLFASLPQG